jgi:putative Ca2+/H+ antiporter (TMEM165/GDT1 family)
METFLVSAGSVALAEMGDKTQLLALFLAARFKAPKQIILGMLIATLANHAGAGALGAFIQRVAGGAILRYAVGALFIALGAWMLKPDKPDATTRGERFGVLGTTIVSFFLAEIGDKTQIATIALASQAHALLLVVLGTTLGMMIANVPVVLAGSLAANRLPLATLRFAAALVFAAVGVLILSGVDFGFLN